MQPAKRTRCETDFLDIPTLDSHSKLQIPDSLSYISPKRAQTWQKSSQIVLDSYRNCFKSRNSARKLLAVAFLFFYYCLAEIYTYPSLIKLLTLDFLSSIAACVVKKSLSVMHSF